MSIWKIGPVPPHPVVRSAIPGLCGGHKEPESTRFQSYELVPQKTLPVQSAGDSEPVGCGFADDTQFQYLR